MDCGATTFMIAQSNLLVLCFTPEPVPAVDYNALRAARMNRNGAAGISATAAPTPVESTNTEKVDNNCHESNNFSREVDNNCREHNTISCDKSLRSE